MVFSAQAAGGARWCLETAAEHARTRQQFGRPIGQFQGVKHRLADMLVAVEQAVAVAWDAAVMIDRGAHLRAFRLVPVPAAAEDDNEPARREFAQRLEDIGQRVVRVGVIDENAELPLDGRSLQAAGHVGRIRQRGHGVAHRDADRRRRGDCRQ